MDHYVIWVDGQLPDDALEGFESLSVNTQAVQTVLQGDLPDQAALAGILDHLDELGVVIAEVVKVPATETEAEEHGEDSPPNNAASSDDR